MKKLILGLVLLASAYVQAANFTVQSFLNPNVSALVVSNAVGATNLNYVYQNQLQGLYLSTTNTLGTSINIPIATNTAPRFYSNSVPTTWYGQQFVGSMVILTNNVFAAAASTNNVQYITAATNNAINFFQDVNLPNDFWTGVAPEAAKAGTATTTNAVAYLQIVSQPFSLYGGAAGNGSNQVNLGFVPIATPTGSNPGSVNPIPGFTPAMEPTDAAVSGGTASTVWTVTYTNQISTVFAPTVVNVPVPRWMFISRGMRLRWIYTDVSTNAIAINSITLNTFTP